MSKKAWKNRLKKESIIQSAKSTAKLVGGVAATPIAALKHAPKAIRGATRMIDGVTEIVKANPIKGTKQVIRGIKDSVQSTAGFLKDAAKPFVQFFNHPEWYENYPLHNLVNLNFGYRNSTNNKFYDMVGISGGSNDGMNTTMATRIDIELTIPKDSNNSFGQAMQILYAKLRAANSGAVNFSIEQLIAYVMNLRSVRAALTQLRRTLSTIYMTNPYDADFPAILCEVSNGAELSQLDGLNFDTVVKHAADIHNYLDIWFNAVRSLAPLNIDLFDRTDWMFSNIFRDSNDIKSNVYMFTLQQVPMYTAGSGSVTTTYYDLTPRKASFEENYEQLLNNMNTIVNILTNSNVNNIIAGDILKTFGSDAFYTQKAFGVGEFVDPIYDEAALTQIQNSSVIGAGNSSLWSQSYTLQNGTSFSVDLENESVSNLTTRNPNSVLINSYKDSISAGETISYTRLAFSGNYVDSTDTLTFETCGTEVVRNVKYYYIKATTSNGTGYNTIGWNDLSGTFNSSAARIVNGWSIMDWSPLLLLAEEDSTAVLWDFNNYAVCSKSQLNQLHQYATLSLLSVTGDIQRQNSFTFGM